MGDELMWLLKEGGGRIIREPPPENRPTPFENRPTLFESKPTQVLKVRTVLVNGIAGKQYRKNSKNSNLYK